MMTRDTIQMTLQRRVLLKVSFITHAPLKLDPDNKHCRLLCALHT